MRILIVRHGLAGSADPRKWPDDDARPLTAEGRRAFARAAAGLRKEGPWPAPLFASPAARTLQTAWILADALGLRREDVLALPALHHAASSRAALKSLARVDPGGDIAVVGHEPRLGELASLLVSGSPRGAALPLGKGAACLVEAEGLAPGAGRLIWSMTQDQLAGLGR